MLADLVLLGFYFDDILEVIDALQRERSQLRIHVLHNNSSRGRQLQSHLRTRLESGAIDSLCFFHKNIGAGAYAAFFDARPVELTAPFVIVADGDILPGPGWLDVLTQLIERQPEVYSASLDLHGLDDEPNAVAPKGEHADYWDRRLGWSFKTFRREDFLRFLDYRSRTGMLFHDQEVFLYGQIVERLSVVAKHVKGEHMRRRHLEDAAYHAEKHRLGANPWDHGVISPFVFSTAEGSTLYPPMPAKRFRPGWRRIELHNPSQVPCTVRIAELRVGGEIRVMPEERLEAGGRRWIEVFGCEQLSYVVQLGESFFTGFHPVRHEPSILELPTPSPLAQSTAATDHLYVEAPGNVLGERTLGSPNGDGILQPPGAPGDR